MLSVVREPAFFAFQRQSLAGEVKQLGIEEWWCAPIAIYDATQGFADETWSSGMPETVLAWHIAGGHVTKEFGLMKGRRVTGPDHITLQAEGAPNHYACKGPIRFGHMAIPQSLFDHVTTELTGRYVSVTLRHDLFSIEDVRLHRTIDDYVQRAFKLPTRLEMEARAILVVERLLTGHHGVQQAPVAQRVDKRVRRAMDYLEARLADEVGLAELGRCVGLSTTHLTAMFRHATGESPHRWLMRRRFERACELLAGSRCSVTEVAHMCGFASSQHLATVFRARLGVTPSAWRRERSS